MRELVAPAHFRKKAGKFIEKHPDLEKKLEKVFSFLAKDVFSSGLKTHKLSGDLNKLYAASIDHQYRVIFSFNDESVFLLNIGSHDEVY